MPMLSDLSSEPAPVAKPWLRTIERGKKLKASGAALAHEYETDTRTLKAPDWVYLQVSWSAYQIHPIAWDDLDQYGAFDGPDMARWTWEGPTSLLPGETPNCTIRCEVAYSTTSSPGSDWKEYREGRYRLQSVKARLVITRPNADYDFRVLRLATRVTRVARRRSDAITERFFHNG